MSILKRIANAVFGASRNGAHTETGAAQADNQERESDAKSEVDLALEADDREYRALMARLKKTSMDFDAALKEKARIQKEFDTQAIKAPRFDLMSEEEIRAATTAEEDESCDDAA